MARSEGPKQVEGGRLDMGDWARAALAQLAIHGVDGVRVELLAKQLGVTKGSFYWHFKDRDALHEHMLDEWRRDATLKLIERVERKTSSPEEKLRHLLRLPLQGKKSQQAADVELAIRLWGRRDDRAAKALREVDKQRLIFISQLLEDCGVVSREARSRAVIAYAYIRVAATLIDSEALEQMKACEDIIISK